VTSSNRLISVLIPLYNHAPYVEECLDSIVNSSYHPIEVIIIDDGSDDGSYETVEQWRQANRHAFENFVLLSHPNSGTNKTLNRALQLAKGELIAILASDDVRARGSFQAQVALFDRLPELKVVYSNGRHWFPDNTSLLEQCVREQVHSPEIIALLNTDTDVVLNYLYTHIPTLYIQTCLFRKDFLCHIDEFDENVIADDWVLNIRIFRNIQNRGEIAVVNTDVFYYRHHPTNSHAHLTGQLHRILQVIDTYIPREYGQKFSSEVYAEFAFRAARQHKLMRFIKYMIVSQTTQFSPIRVLWLFWRVVSAGTRKLRNGLQRVGTGE
jgi:glycosyltransferase involved in cell wall biosynthesis